MIRKIINTLGTRLFSALLNLLIAIIISQYLGTIGKGQQGLIITTITYILVFSNLVGGSTLVYLVPRYGIRSLILPSYLWTILMGLIFYFILRISNIVAETFVLNICILAILSSFISIHTNLLLGIEKVRTANLLGLLQPLFILLALFIFFINSADLSIQHYFKSLYFSYCIVFIWSLIIIKNQFKTIQHKSVKFLLLIKEMLRLGVMNQLAHIFQLLSFRMSYYWLGQVYTEAEVGIFSNGTSLIESVWLISRSMSLVQYSIIVNMTNKMDAQLLTLRLVKLSFVISFFILVIMVLLPTVFYEFIFGKGFGEVQLVIRALAPGVLILNLNIILSHYFSGTGRFYKNSIASLAGLIIAIPLFSSMIPAYRLWGAGFASSISYIATSLVILYFFMKDSGFHMNDFLIRKTDIVQFKQLLKTTFLTKDKIYDKD